MRQWNTTALDAEGRVLHRRVSAPDEAGVARQLRLSGAVPLDIRPDRGGAAGVFGRASLSRQDLAQILRELATMLSAGQDLDRALQFLVQTSSGTRVRRVIEQLHDSVRDGGALAAAMAEQPRAFPPLVIGMIRGGEAGGSLAVTLERLATLTERQHALSVTIRSAMIYPCLLLVAAGGAVGLMLTQILPQFVPLFEQNGAVLPPSTRFLLDAGDIIARDWQLGLGGLVIALSGLWLARRRPGPRLLLDRIVLRLPVIGTLRREIIAARLCRTLGTLLRNGVALVPALGITRDVLGNSAAVIALEQATEAARDGGGLSGPLGKTGIFPVRTVHLLRLGEETAQLADVALRAADIHEETVRVITGRLTALLTPLITIVMGAVIAGIVSSLLLAMLSLNDLAR